MSFEETSNQIFREQTYPRWNRLAQITSVFWNKWLRFRRK